MKSVGPEGAISLIDILPLTPAEFLTGQLPSLSDRTDGEIVKVINAPQAERSPVVAYSYIEDITARRGLWRHINIMRTGITNRVSEDRQKLTSDEREKIDRAVARATCEALYKVGGHIDDAKQSISRLGPFSTGEDKITETDYYWGLISLAEFVRAQRRTSGKPLHPDRPHDARAWPSAQAHETHQKEFTEAFKEVCAMPAEERKDKAAIAINANQSRVRFWRQQLAAASLHPDVRELINLIRQVGPLDEVDVPE